MSSYGFPNFPFCYFSYHAITTVMSILYCSKQHMYPHHATVHYVLYSIISQNILYHTILQSPVLYHTMWDCVTFNRILLRNAKLCQTIVKCSKPYLNRTFGALPPYHLVSSHNSTLTVVILRFLVSLTNEVVRELIKDQRSNSASKQKKGLVYTIHSAVKIPG